MPHRFRDECAVALSSEASSVSDARDFVRQTLKRWDLSRLGDTVILLTSELATNAVVHAGTSYDVVIELSDSSVRVSVLDDSPLPAGLREHGLHATSGRGVELVEALSEHWGMLPPPPLDGRIKGMWFEVPTAEPSPPTAQEAGYGGELPRQLQVR